MYSASADDYYVEEYTEGIGHFREVGASLSTNGDMLFCNCSGDDNLYIVWGPSDPHEDLEEVHLESGQCVRMDPRDISENSRYVKIGYIPTGYTTISSVFATSSSMEAEYRCRQTA